MIWIKIFRYINKLPPPPKISTPNPSNTKFSRLKNYELKSISSVVDYNGVNNIQYMIILRGIYNSQKRWLVQFDHHFNVHYSAFRILKCQYFNYIWLNLNIKKCSLENISACGHVSICYGFIAWIVYKKWKKVYKEFRLSFSEIKKDKKLIDWFFCLESTKFLFEIQIAL